MEGKYLVWRVEWRLFGPYFFKINKWANVPAVLQNDFSILTEDVFFDIGRDCMYFQILQDKSGSNIMIYHRTDHTVYDYLNKKYLERWIGVNGHIR